MKGGKKQLRKVVWAPSIKCNQNCSFCYGYDNEKIFCLKTYFKIANKLCRLGANRFIWSGGEPLVFKFLDNLILHAAKKKIENVVVTNGRSLTAERIKRFAGVADEIRISIHSLDPKINAKLNISKNNETGGEYERLMLKNLHSVKGRNIKLAVSTVYLGQSEKDLKNMAKEFEKAGVLEWTFQQQTQIRGDAVFNKGLWTTSHIESVINKLKKLCALNIVLNSKERLNNEYEIVNPLGKLIAVRGGKDIIVGDVAKESVRQLRKKLQSFWYE